MHRAAAEPSGSPRLLFSDCCLATSRRYATTHWRAISSPVTMVTCPLIARQQAGSTLGPIDGQSVVMWLLIALQWVKLYSPLFARQRSHDCWSHDRQERAGSMEAQKVQQQHHQYVTSLPPPIPPFPVVENPCILHRLAILLMFWFSRFDPAKLQKDRNQENYEKLCQSQPDCSSLVLMPSCMKNYTFFLALIAFIQLHVVVDMWMCS